MENASKALIIAGAILISILIIAIAMFIYNSAREGIDSSLTGMSTQEKNAFNAQFENYEGSQSGTQIKSLINLLLSNLETYKEEGAKVPSIEFSGATTPTYDSVSYSDTSDYDDYVNHLNQNRSDIKAKHTYTVDFTYSSAVITTIKVKW